MMVRLSLRDRVMSIWTELSKDQLRWFRHGEGDKIGEKKMDTVDDNELINSTAK